MEWYQIYCLSSLAILLAACTGSQDYQRSYTEQEKYELSRGLVEAAGNTAYYQGSSGERALLMDAMMYDTTYAELHRELAIPYLKRGYPDLMHLHYSDAVKYEPCTWSGYVAYAYLYFLRDYGRCISLCHMIDDCTPDFTDYPQSTSVDYMRGLSFLKLGSLDSAQYYLERHINSEVAEVGVKYVGIPDQIALAEVYRQQGFYAKASEVLDRARSVNAPTAEIVFHEGLLARDRGFKSEARRLFDESLVLISREAITTRPYVDEFFVPDEWMVSEAIAKLDEE